ncbi:hypothetical protein ZWY2020_021567 [Hordeum vulgare]|nr:hypothetical protein ZWY2020_021567 [Hordeum vulgare]
MVCCPTNLGGLGILELYKFARALRLHWLWFAWVDPLRAWVGLETPCNDDDMELFFAATTITIGDGLAAPFWHSPWLNGQNTKDIASSIFACSRLTKVSVAKAMNNNKWIRHINLEGGMAVTIIHQFYILLSKCLEVELTPGINDDIPRKFTIDGCYFATPAYKMQFAGLIKPEMPRMVWMIWAPPKIKLFSWLILQDKVWTTDRLLRRLWPNCGLCYLCKREQETAAHLMFKCRYTIRVWNLIYVWLGQQSSTPSWHDLHTVKQWWNSDEGQPRYLRKEINSLQTLI